MAYLEYRHPVEPSDFRPALKLLIIWIATIIIAIAIVVAVFWFFEVRSIPFDSSKWIRGGSHVRFRMKDSLLSELAVNKYPSRTAIDRILGRDGNHNRDLNSRTYEVEDWDGSPWDVTIRFDERGTVKSFDAMVE